MVYPTTGIVRSPQKMTKSHIYLFNDRLLNIIKRGNDEVRSKTKVFRKIFSLLIVAVLVFIFSPFSEQAHAKDSSVKAENVNGLQINDSNYNRLLSLGFTSDEINNMNQGEYNQNKGLSGYGTKSTTTYYKEIETYKNVSDTNSMQSLASAATISSSDNPKVISVKDIELSKKDFYAELNQANANKVNKTTSDLLVQATGDSATNSTHTSYKTMTVSVTQLSSKTFRVKDSVTWKIMPLNRSYDFIGVGINSAHFNPNNDSNKYAKQSWTLHNYDTGKNTNDSAVYSSSSSD
jgi:hypothetical protein